MVFKMRGEFTKKFKIKGYHKLGQNFLSLLFLQGSNYILPLLTIPYVVKTFGPEVFGALAFAQAFTQYFVILVDFGFDLSATRQVSMNRNNLPALQAIFTSVILIKILLFFFGLIMFFIILYFLPQAENFKSIFCWFYFSVLGQVLFPVWFFQGIENMKYLTYINFLTKAAFNLSILFVINSKEDAVLYPIFLTISSLVGSLVSWIICFKKFKLRVVTVNFDYIKYQFREGFSIFISNVTTSIYTISSTFILGIFYSNVIVGYYAAAEKVIRAFQGLLSPIFITIYPYGSKLFQESRKDGIQFLRKVVKFVSIPAFLFSCLIFALAPVIIQKLFGSAYQESVVILRILSWIPFIVCLNNIFGIQTLLNLNYKKDFFKILLISSTIHLFILIIFSYYFKHVGVSITVLFTECLITILMYKCLLSKGIQLIKF